jgi:lipoprotein-anchoring transpeptidase ErfK/SrfK
MGKRSTPIRSCLVTVAALLVGAGSAYAGVDPPPRAAPCVVPVAGSTAAVLVRRTTAYRRPNATPFARFRTLNANAYPTVFAVLAARGGPACAPRWLRVELPRRPNGVTGWVRARDVQLVRLATRIDVDLSARLLVLRRHGHVLLRTRTAVGAPSTPTPLGRFYVNQRLLPYDPHGAFGPAALGVSAFSPVLTSWVQGGPIAIHGTDEPWSVGRAVSNGCIRVPNRVMTRLFRLVPAGTPVFIHA